MRGIYAYGEKRHGHYPYHKPNTTLALGEEGVAVVAVVWEKGRGCVEGCVDSLTRLDSMASRRRIFHILPDGRAIIICPQSLSILSGFSFFLFDEHLSFT